ncbi:helix-turn-helix transcriptional regulator [Streptomyces sp. SID3343]|uniref:helix-turn-helix transcriptional regulator n=1 Tax=Streptomyces sp. SID3343 TaxID=2690260 RepID=UPI00136D7F7D|nr:helix-turn-helix transcriptional regulator [Streptomyces sp. SID3343]MYW02335.1 hypothetical protein [Streptomyces sp. SID3343]
MPLHHRLLPVVGGVVRERGIGLPPEAVHELTVAIALAIRPIVQPPPPPRELAPLDMGSKDRGLPTRLVQCLVGIGRGGSAVQVAEALGICETSVRSNLTDLHRHFRVPNRVSAVVAALRLGVITLDDLTQPPGKNGTDLPPVTGYGPHRPLSRQHRLLLIGMGRGHTNARLAADLGLSPLTVKRHVRAVCDALGVATRQDAVLAGLRAGLICFGDLDLDLAPGAPDRLVPPPRQAALDPPVPPVRRRHASRKAQP